MEDANALILRCDSEDLKKTWQSHLQGAIYRASVDLRAVSLVDDLE